MIKKTFTLKYSVKILIQVLERYIVSQFGVNRCKKRHSQFTDKQIMDVSSSSPPCTDFIDLMNNTDSLDEHHLKQRIGDNGLEDEMVPSYDFQPIRPSTAVGLSHDLAGSSTCTAAKNLESASDFKPIPTWPNRVIQH